MFAVIFKARLKAPENLYFAMASELRERAKSYGCVDIVSVTQGNEEITVSYWRELNQLQQWKNDSEHLMAQNLGKTKWYDSYTVQVCEIQREYHFEPEFTPGLKSDLKPDLKQ